MILTKNSLLDGQLEFSKGVDTYRAPVRVPRNQCCLLVNNTTRQDFIGPRPAWKQIPLQFVKFNESTRVYEPDAQLQSDFETGFFQGFNGYVPDIGASHLVWSISGKLFRVNMLTNGTVQSIPLPDANPDNRPLVWFCQGELFLIIQDGQSVPLIYNGSSVRRSNVSGKGGTDADGKPLVEVPVGTCMAYSGGRLWVTLADGMHFVAGDGVYGPTGTAAYGQRDSILRFTENLYLNGGFPFAVPSNMGPIRAMVVVANLDTSLGQGPLQVFTPSGCFSIEAPFDRAQWANVQYPIKTVSLLDQGALSQRGTILVNGDIWYRSLDGWRSFIIARRDFGSWGNRAMSYEVIKHLKDDDRNLLDRQSAAHFDNRSLVTVEPQWDAKRGVYHKGLVALDFIPLTTATGLVGLTQATPVWDGLWVGPGDLLQVQRVESQGVEHCYAAVLAPADDQGVRHIQLWELQRNGGPDTPLIGGPQRVSRVMEGPKLDFQNRVEQKMLEAAEIWYDKISGNVDFTLYHRPDEHACWFFWKHWTVCAKTQRCAGDAVNGCMPSLNLRRQFRSRIGALRPPDAEVPGTGQPSRLGYTHQYRLEITGDVEVTAIRVLATRIVEASFGAPGDAQCEEVICCEPDDFSPNSISDTPPDQSGGTPPSGGGETPPDDGGSTPPLFPNLPAWPIPSPFVCSGDAQHGPLYVTDPLSSVSNPVGINPGDQDPVSYINGLNPAALPAWCAAVWADFLGAHIPYASARLIWSVIHITGDNWMAFQVFPDQLGGYLPVIDLDYRIVVEYCPL